MTNPRPRNPPTDLIELTERYLQRDITDAQLEALNRLLASGDDLRRRFIDLCTDAQHLTRAFSQRDHQQDLSRRLAALTDAKKKETGDRGQGTVPVSAAGAPIYRKGHEPNSAISNFQFSIFNFQFLLTAAALLAACGLAIYLFALNPEPSPPEPPAQPLANLIENASEGTLTTPGGFISEGRDYPRGEYALDRGTAEFMLTNAVNVKLRGETRMSMHNDMNVSLTRGSAEFVCPTAAKGFTVHLPNDTKIVDLGTRFEVTLDDSGHSIVKVTEGLVRLEHASGQTMNLAAGRFARIPRDVSQPIVLAVNVVLPIVNGGFESDDATAEGATDWTIATGGTATEFWTTAGAGLSPKDPTGGQGGSTNFLTANRLANGTGTNANPATATQSIDVSAYATDIDGGGVTIDLDFYYSTDGNDPATVAIEFFDAGLSSLGSIATGNLIHGPATWLLGDLVGAVPIGTRSLEITLGGSRSSGIATNVSFDSISGTLLGVSDQPTLDTKPIPHASESVDSSRGHRAPEGPSSENNAPL